MSERRFGALHPEETDFNKMVADKIIGTSFFNKGLTDDVIRAELNDAVGKTNLDNPDAARALRWLVEAFNTATEKVVESKLQYA